jgi:hypothetical protein
MIITLIPNLEFREKMTKTKTPQLIGVSIIGEKVLTDFDLVGGVATRVRVRKGVRVTVVDFLLGSSL